MFPEPRGLCAPRCSTAVPGWSWGGVHFLEKSMSIKSFDATVWAAEFKKINPDADEDVMLGWFANALMRGWDEHVHRHPTAGRLSLLRDMTSDPTMHAAPYVTHDTVDGETRQVVWWRVARFVSTPDDPWSIGAVEPVLVNGNHWLAGPSESEAINEAIAYYDNPSAYVLKD